MGLLRLKTEIRQAMSRIISSRIRRCVPLGALPEPRIVIRAGLRCLAVNMSKPKPLSCKSIICADGRDRRAPNHWQQAAYNIT
jgi:hypothetical protein